MMPTQTALAHTVVVLDFETTGVSPGHGDRAIEIGAVLLENGQLKDRYQALMNPGFRISRFIENYTGISNAMLRDAPPCDVVMREFAQFLGEHHMVAHNASFDQRFLKAEFERIGHRHRGHFACSMLLARRLFQDAPNHKLGTLVEYKRIPHTGVFHRALADAEMTAQLWLLLLAELTGKTGIETPSFALTQDISRQPKAAVGRYLNRLNF